MKKIFREYHQYTEQEFKQLWKNCLFVFDANILLNMYRYSRATVNAYFDVLNELKKKKQLWIPYQAGYEFYENRINVISEYEKSYNEILSILEKAKNEIETKYKDHPFLNLYEIKEEMNKGLAGVEKKIKQAQKNHPKWLENDEVLEKINQLFEGNIGNNYDEKKLNEINKEGKERYEKKIPPGFKDNKKSEDKKYGDLILWYQIIDKAKECKKPMVLISGDVKEDWWLEKDGKRLMPLPQLKKEISDKAGVDFHIYTADRFLELNKTEKTDINTKTINEVRKIRELEEEKMMLERKRKLEPRIFYRNYSELIYHLDMLENLIMKIKISSIPLSQQEELANFLRSIRDMRNGFAHGEGNAVHFDTFYWQAKEIFYKILRSDAINPDISAKFRDLIERLEYLNQRLTHRLNE